MIQRLARGIQPFLEAYGAKTTGRTAAIRYRKLGLIVARGTLLVVISPVDGSEEIPNPFIQEEE